MRAPAGAVVRVRDARPADLARIQAIYAEHVLHGLASFEEVPPDEAEIARRYQATLDLGLPYLAADLESADGSDPVRGYAYAGPYRTRPAYRYTVEDSVYVDPEAARLGIGRALLDELIRRCTALGYRQMLAVIGDSDNRASIGLHEALGFSRAGLLSAVGYKFGRWVDCVMMQRPLGAGEAPFEGRPAARA